MNPEIPEIHRHSENPWGAARSAGPPLIVLASASPRRLRLLTEAGIVPEVRPADVDETPGEGESPEAYVMRVAGEKARATVEADEFVIGADTAVAVDLPGGTRILGKPAGRTEAAEMLRLLSGRSHKVHTGHVVCCLGPGGERRDAGSLATTTVTFVPLSETDIERYVATGESADKAGAYAIQGRAARFVRSLDGSLTNVVGLDVPTVLTLLRLLGWNAPPPPGTLP